MYSNADFINDCQMLFEQTKGNAVDIPGIVKTVLYDAPLVGFASADDYCIKCGVCAKNCPAKAISLKHGKNNIKCRMHVETMRKKYSPRYGCGKCQVGVPCEFRAPRRPVI